MLFYPRHPGVASRSVEASRVGAYLLAQDLGDTHKPSVCKPTWAVPVLFIALRSCHAHLLMPAVLAAYGVRLNGKRQVLVHDQNQHRRPCYTNLKHKMDRVSRFLPQVSSLGLSKKKCGIASGPADRRTPIHRRAWIGPSISTSNASK